MIALIWLLYYSQTISFFRCESCVGNIGDWFQLWSYIVNVYWIRPFSVSYVLRHACQSKYDNKVVRYEARNYFIYANSTWHTHQLVFRDKQNLRLFMLTSISISYGNDWVISCSFSLSFHLNFAILCFRSTLTLNTVFTVEELHHKDWWARDGSSKTKSWR